MRTTAIAMMIIAFGVAGAMQMLPGDGATHTSRHSRFSGVCSALVGREV